MNQRDIVQRIPFTCTLDCGSRCELVAAVQNGDIVRIDTPLGRRDTVQRPRLVPCARGRSQGRARIAAERVHYPLRRSGPRGSGQFQRTGWAEVLDEIAQRLDDVATGHGTISLLHATGAGSISGRGFSGAAASERFFQHWGPVTGMMGGMSEHCAAIAADWMLGQRVSGSDRATLLDSKLIILWGMNPAETHMGPNTAYFIAEARDQGARVVLIDPRYTDSAVFADQWIPILPGTDAALAAAIAYTLETRGLVDRAFMASHTVGYEAYQRYVLGDEDDIPKTPEWAAARTGIPAAVIGQLAHDYGTIKPAALLPGWAPQRTLYGEQIARALITLACMSGNVGIRGGSLASIGTRRNVIPVEGLPRGPHTPARRVYTGSWARAMVNEQLRPPIKMAYVVASNLINRSPDTRTNVRALAKLDYIVVHEPFLTPTAQHADIVLPVCTDLERTDLVTSWGHDLHLFYSRQVVAPAGEARTDYWIFAELAERLGFGEAYTHGMSEAEWLQQLLDARHLAIEDLKRDGIMREDGEPRVALAGFRADPVAHPLHTPSGKIEISCARAQDYGLPAIPSYVEIPVVKDALQLITPHYKFRSNSCLHAVPWLRRLEPHTVWINPRDAIERGIADGEFVEVFNERGVVRLPAKVTERIIPGVVCVYQGAWYQPGQDGADDGGCANVLTEQRETPTGGYATHSTWVQVRGSGS